MLNIGHTIGVIADDGFALTGGLYYDICGCLGHKATSAEFADELSADLSENPGVRFVSLGAAPAAGFDILIVNGRKRTGLLDNLKQDGLIIANSDEPRVMEALFEFGGGRTAITYGLNRRACVTLSSIGDCAASLCVQRELPRLGGGLVEEQELPLRWRNASTDVHAVMAAATAALILGDA